MQWELHKTKKHNKDSIYYGILLMEAILSKAELQELLYNALVELEDNRNHYW